MYQSGPLCIGSNAFHLVSVSRTTPWRPRWRSWLARPRRPSLGKRRWRNLHRVGRFWKKKAVSRDMSRWPTWIMTCWFCEVEVHLRSIARFHRRGAARWFFLWSIKEVSPRRSRWMWGVSQRHALDQCAEWALRVEWESIAGEAKTDWFWISWSAGWQWWAVCHSLCHSSQAVIQQRSKKVLLVRSLVAPPLASQINPFF